VEYSAGASKGIPSFAGLNETNFEGSRQAALDYHHLGFTVTPLNGKAPVLQRWQEREMA